MLGYGSGELHLGGRQALRTDLRMTMGVRGTVLSSSQAGGVELAVRSDVLWIRMVATESEASWSRLVLEGSRQVSLADGGVLTPTLEIGLRQDGNDAETGGGV